jgi:hypothetical protein
VTSVAVFDELELEDALNAEPREQTFDAFGEPRRGQDRLAE